MHTYCIGATRAGKTNYLLSFFNPEGAYCFIDKHGEAARQIADAMECIYWRPAEGARSYARCVIPPLGTIPILSAEAGGPKGAGQLCAGPVRRK
jgi:hypothetical protein